MLNYFRRRNIRPNPATEAQKRALAEKLQKKQSMGASNPQPQQEVEFWGQKKEVRQTERYFIMSLLMTSDHWTTDCAAVMGR